MGENNSSFVVLFYNKENIGKNYNYNIVKIYFIKIKTLRFYKVLIGKLLYTFHFLLASTASLYYMLIDY